MARTPVVMFETVMPGQGFDRTAFAEAITRRLARYDRHAERVDEHPAGPPGDPGRVAGRGAFMDQGEAEEFVEWLAGRLGQTGGPQGRVSYHLCSHALGEAATEPCTDVVTGYYERTG